MLPKLLLAPMRTYLRMLAKTFRPSTTPASRTSKDFSSRIMSADAFATSTAVSTLIPTSAACKAGASLMPSPMKPTVCLRDCRALMMRCLWTGETRANSVAPTAASASCASDIFSRSLPSSTKLSGQPDLGADLARDQVVVSRDDLDGHAMALQGLDRCRGCLFRRVEEGRIAVQDQVALVGFRVGSGVARNDTDRLNVFTG